MSIWNKICFLSGVIGFHCSKGTSLSLDKAFLYYFQIRHQAKYINFKEVTAILQAITRQIKTFRRFYLHVFCNNFAIILRVQKTSIKGKIMQSLWRITMFSVVPRMILKWKYTRFLPSIIFWLIYYYAINILKFLINILFYRQIRIFLKSS